MSVQGLNVSINCLSVGFHQTNLILSILLSLYPEPSYVTMTANSVIASSKEAFYAWQYKSVKKLTTLELQSNTNKHGKKEGAERSQFAKIYFIYLLFFGYFIHHSFS